MYMFLGICVCACVRACMHTFVFFPYFAPCRQQNISVRELSQRVEITHHKHIMFYIRCDNITIDLKVQKRSARCFCLQADSVLRVINTSAEPRVWNATIYNQPLTTSHLSTLESSPCDIKILVFLESFIKRSSLSTNCDSCPRDSQPSCPIVV